MAQKHSKALKRRIAGAYISSVISIALVLLLVGVASLLIGGANDVSVYFKENVKVSVIFKQKVTQAQAGKYQLKIEQKPYVRSTHLVTVEEGTAELAAMLGEDFLGVFATNPVPLSVDVTLKAEYVCADSLAFVQKDLGESSLVEEVSCQMSLVQTLEKSIAKISMVLGVLTLLLLFVSVVLISNTVRLNLHAQRFTIHTMQLVGATRSFIAGPFIWKAAVQGLFAALLAVAVMVAALFVVKTSFAQIFELFSLPLLLSSVLVILVSGIGICVTSTFFIVNKITTLSNDELYG